MEGINVKIIEDYIKNNNLSKTKFCKMCGISLYNLNKILKNDLTVKIIPLLKVIKYIDISSCDLIIWE